MATPSERSLRQLADELEVETEFDIVPEELTVDDPASGEAVVVELPDGGAEVSLEENIETPEIPFEANLAEYVLEQDLRHIGSELLSLIEADKRSRRDWEQTYKKGLDNLGLKIEKRTEPWPGACAATHPLLAEAVVRFQSQTIGEIFPAHGPVKTSIAGKSTQEKEKQAKRVQDYMNYVILNQMEEYRPETEKMLFSLPLAGSTFRKVYYDGTKGRPASMFLPAEDVIVNYSAIDIRSADRVTHRIKMSPNEVRKRQVSGFYRDLTLTPPSHNIEDAVGEKIDDLTGRQHTIEKDNRHILYECHCEWDIPGFEDEHGIALPYVITIDKNSQKILAIYRNWEEEDQNRVANQHFVHYEFIPGLGFYGFGLVHLIGGLAAATTALLRQLVDAGTLANLPGGLKTRGMRMKGDDTPILPGEWRDVDVPGGTIKDNIFPLPYKDPSTALYQLLVYIVEAGQRFASMADLKVADMNQEAPVGTTLAIMERAMKVQSAIQARIHAGLKQEFKMLAEIISAFTEPAYPYETDPGEGIKESDFDERIDVIPVSDPNAATMAQRIMQYQAVLQLASQQPQMYNLKLLHRQIIEVLGVANAENIVPMQEEIPPTDPITENANILNMSPVQAHQHQDHEAHLKVHRILLQDPQIQEMLNNSQAGPAIAGAIDAHVREHLAWLYRAQIEKELGAPLPPVGEPLPPDVEKRLSTLTAEAAEILLGKKQAQFIAEQNAALMQDPVIQQKERELDIRQSEVERKRIDDMTKAQLDARKAEIDRELKLIEIAQKREKEALESATELAIKDKEHYLEAVKLGKEIGEALDNIDLQNKKSSES